MHYICPHCKQPLEEYLHCFQCANHHTFDRAKQGYVNLLTSQKSSHGDDKIMVRARRNFLEGGFYQPLQNLLIDTIAHLPFSRDNLLDAGCGEGYYTSAIANALPHSQVWGIDVSKTAVAMAAKTNANIHWSVASVYQLPFGNSTTDIILSVFSPFATEEFLRLLKPEGLVIQVIPLEEHLWQLKQILYQTPYRNTPSQESPSGLSLYQSHDLKYTFRISDRQQLQDLFAMTPYYYTTSPQDKERLALYNNLEINAQFRILVYKKSNANN